MTTYLHIDLINHPAPLYCEADSNYTIIHLHNGKRMVKSVTLKTVEGALNSSRYLRTHSKYLVDKACIQFVDKKASIIRLVNGEELPISRRKKRGVLESLLHIK